MLHEIDLINKKAITILNATTNQKTKTLLIDIVDLSNACLKAINNIDTNLTDICLSIRRVTTDIE